MIQKERKKTERFLLDLRLRTYWDNPTVNISSVCHFTWSLSCLCLDKQDLSLSVCLSHYGLVRRLSWSQHHSAFLLQSVLVLNLRPPSSLTPELLPHSPFDSRVSLVEVKGQLTCSVFSPSCMIMSPSQNASASLSVAQLSYRHSAEKFKLNVSDNSAQTSDGPVLFEEYKCCIIKVRLVQIVLKFRRRHSIQNRGPCWKKHYRPAAKHNICWYLLGHQCFGAGLCWYSQQGKQRIWGWITVSNQRTEQPTNNVYEVLSTHRWSVSQTEVVCSYSQRSSRSVQVSCSVPNTRFEDKHV